MNTNTIAIYRLLLSLCLITPFVLRADERPDFVIADFEGDSYGDWKVEGDAFGTGPASGTLPNQMRVSGYLGKKLVNSFHHGDKSIGKLTSPEFIISRPWVNFLIGGGGYAGETCMNLTVEGKLVRTATGPNAGSGDSEELHDESWDVTEFIGKKARIEIVDKHQGGWGHINVDQIVLSDKQKAPALVRLEKQLVVDGSHLIVPVANEGKISLLGIYDGDKLVQNFNVVLPHGDAPFWFAAYPLDHFGLKGKSIKLAPVDGAKIRETAKTAFDRIKIGSATDALQSDDYQQPYRDQFHLTTRRGWNNDPNGMVYHNGKYHVYYQHNPFGIGWGNMHWGHFESTDLLHWKEKPIALFQKTVSDAMFSGGGFVDTEDTAGLGKDTQFVAFTSTGRGECLAYSKDGGQTFTELPENPVVKHTGRDPKVIWYAPEKKWVMVVYDETPCEETKATPSANGKAEERNMAFYESKNLRQWTRTGAFTDPDREAVFECPELFEAPIVGKPGQSRWVLLGAQNRFFIGAFNGKTFTKEFGPQTGPRGAIYAAQTFSNTPDGRRIQIGWVRTQPLTRLYPKQIVSQGFTLPHELTLQETNEGLRVMVQPIKESERLRGEVLATSVNDLKKCEGELTEVLIEFAESGRHEVVINGIDASFNGRVARVFTDRTFNEVYVDGGIGYFSNARSPSQADSTETIVRGESPKSLRAYRLKSIWK